MAKIMSFIKNKIIDRNIREVFPDLTKDEINDFCTSPNLYEYTLGGITFDEYHPKYVLLKDVTHTLPNGIILYRILYRNGALGGWLQSYENLSQEGLCRVLDEAKVYSNSHVLFEAIVAGNAEISENSSIRGISMVYDDAIITNRSNVTGKTSVFGNAKVDNLSIYGDTQYYADTSNKVSIVGNSEWKYMV